MKKNYLIILFLTLFSILTACTGKEAAKPPQASKANSPKNINQKAISKNVNTFDKVFQISFVNKLAKEDNISINDLDPFFGSSENVNIIAKDFCKNISQNQNISNDLVELFNRSISDSITKFNYVSPPFLMYYIGNISVDHNCPQYATQWYSYRSNNDIKKVLMSEEVFRSSLNIRVFNQRYQAYKQISISTGIPELSKESIEDIGPKTCNLIETYGIEQFVRRYNHQNYLIGLNPAIVDYNRYNTLISIRFYCDYRYNAISQEFTKALPKLDLELLLKDSGINVHYF